MTSLAAADPDVRTFTATVESVDDDAVVLDETYFYAEGGGQPADRGTLGEVAVTDVQHRDGTIVHELAETPSFESGDVVEGSVDDAFRTYCMRAHTASHLLYGSGRRLLDDLGYGGFDISAGANGARGEETGRSTDDAIGGKVRVDFATSTPIDDETLVELERLTNRAVWDSYDVTWEQLPRNEALDRDDVAFNTKTEEGIAGDAVRVVTIEDWDVAACGGTHVRNTSEVGPVAVVDRSNPGEGLTRVEFTVGPPAIDRRAVDHERALAAATALDTRIEELPGAVERLREERDDLRASLDDLREDRVAARIDELRDDVVRKDGSTWLVGTLPDLDANELSEQAQAVVSGDGSPGEDQTLDAVAFVGEAGEYLAVATTGDVDAGDVVDAATDEFGGGGGGGPTAAQGGGLGADAGEVVAFLRE